MADHTQAGITILVMSACTQLSGLWSLLLSPRLIHLLLMASTSSPSAQWLRNQLAEAFRKRSKFLFAVVFEERVAMVVLVVSALVVFSTTLEHFFVSVVFFCSCQDHYNE